MSGYDVPWQPPTDQDRCVYCGEEEGDCTCGVVAIIALLAAEAPTELLEAES